MGDAEWLASAQDHDRLNKTYAASFPTPNPKRSPAASVVSYLGLWSRWAQTSVPSRRGTRHSGGRAALGTFQTRYV